MSALVSILEFMSQSDPESDPESVPEFVLASVPESISKPALMPNR